MHFVLTKSSITNITISCNGLMFCQSFRKPLYEVQSVEHRNYTRLEKSLRALIAVHNQSDSVVYTNNVLKDIVRLPMMESIVDECNAERFKKVRREGAQKALDEYRKYVLNRI